ncbi:MAG: hypothetical protein IPK85_02535 [Gemmatimonadetes bacterium]|nr:hypothetical protein [Gemmatimonadota bacterium]
MDGAGISALLPTVGLSGLQSEHDGMVAAARALEAGQRGNPMPSGPRMPSSVSELIPPTLRDRLPSAEMIANLILGMAPGSGDYMAARDAIGATGAGLSALGQGDYMRAGARGVDAFTAMLGTVPFIPYFAGMASKPSTYQVGDRIRKYASEMGWEVTDTARSGASGSNYLHLARPSGKVDKYGDPIMDHVKLRISDHDLPPTYKRTIGEADYDVGVGGKSRMDEQGGWADAVGWLARRAGVEPPKGARRYMTPQAAPVAASAMEPESVARALASNPAAMDMARRIMAPGVPRDQMLAGLKEVSDMLGGEVTVYGLSNAMIGLR